MNKFNMAKIGAVILSIVLLTSYVFAQDSTPVQTDEGTSASGGGMIDNPFIINGKTVVTYTALPFYFQVTNDGSYELKHDAVSKKVTFIPVESQSFKTNSLTNIEVQFDEIFNNVDSFQLGVTPVKSEKASTAVHDIEEISSYISREAIYANRYLGTSIERFDNYCRVSRQVKLHNVIEQSSSSAAYGGKSDLYYFATSKGKSNIGDLFTPLYYELESNDGDWITYKLKEELYVSSEGILLEDQKRTVTIPTASNSSVPDDVSTIMYKFNGNESALNEESVSTIEQILTWLLTSIGDVILNAFKAIMGSDLSVSSLIFNTYEDTKIDLYNQSGGGGVSQTVRDVVNYWFEMFASIAYIGYMIVLVYIGIQMILGAGTEKQSKTRAYFGNWVMGLLILLILPTFGIKLIVQLNEAFVKYMSKGRAEVKSYYNFYDSDDDILGSDSSTISIEELLGLKQKTEEDLAGSKSDIDKAITNIANRAVSNIENRGFTLTDDEKNLVKTLVNNVYSILKISYNRDGEITDSTLRSAIAVNQDSLRWIQNVQIRGEVSQQISSDEMKSLMKTEFLNAYQLEDKLDYIDMRLEVAKTDFMGLMRGYAGHYHRLIYAILWLLLLFQLIGLTFLYFKRVFVIAILIAVFPIIMLFYCIDKMADGAAQTLRLWVKEFLANVFIQSVHAVIYTVLIEMGLNIYSADTTDWIFFVAAMLLILPAETIMKEVFDLNGSSLRQVGGMLGKGLALATAAKGFSTAAKGGSDKSIQDKREARFNKLQEKQNRADMKSQKRQANQLRKDPNSLNADGSVNLTGARALREKAYHVGTNARQLKNNVSNSKVARAASGVLRETKNTVAIAAGMAYGLAGGDVESMAQGAQIAAGLTGKTTDVKKSEKKDVKHELKAAYSRKKKE